LHRKGVLTGERAGSKTTGRARPFTLDPLNHHSICQLAKLSMGPSAAFSCRRHITNHIGCAWVRACLRVFPSTAQHSTAPHPLSQSQCQRLPRRGWVLQPHP
jgi:hypothetical protein